MPPKKQSTSVLAPLGPVFSLLNVIALCGWTYVLLALLVALASEDNAPSLEDLYLPVAGLEGICLVEVIRIVLGDLPGNVVLGVVLHAIRCTCLTFAWSAHHWTGPVILASWTITEVTRYPMYIFPQLATLRSVRMVVPLATFPVGAFAEAYATYLQWEEGLPWWKQGLFGALLFVNGVLGPTMAYPALLKKGLPVLGLAKKIKKKKS
jgi:hypothetical protein